MKIVSLNFLICSMKSSTGVGVSKRGKRRNTEVRRIWYNFFFFFLGESKLSIQRVITIFDS